MPRANWGVRSRDIDDFDRSKQFAPYTGPTPPLGVYKFVVKVLKYVPATDDKNPQMRIGLSLVPRDKTEKRYAGYFLMDFPPITDKTQFRYVPFLDAIGVGSREFERNTITDEEGNIKRIGKWKMDGTAEVLAQVKEELDEKKQPRRGIGWYGEVTEEEEALDEDDEGEYEEEEEFEDDEEEY